MKVYGSKKKMQRPAGQGKEVGFYAKETENS